MGFFIDFTTWLWLNWWANYGRMIIEMKDVTVAGFLAHKAKEREIEDKKFLDKIKRKWRRKDHSKGWRKHMRHLKAVKRRGEGVAPKGWTCTRKVQNGEKYNICTRRYEPIFQNCGFCNQHDDKVCAGCHQPRYGR